MKSSRGLILFLFTLSIISGYLMSKVSVVGKAGMSLFYKQYNFLKVWWKGALLIMITLTVLYYIHSFIQKKLNVRQGKTVQRIAFFLALTGIYFTYDDFRHSLSHHFLGERFHIGVYLFWIGWIAISLFFLAKEKQRPINDMLHQQDEPGIKPVS